MKWVRVHMLESQFTIHNNGVMYFDKLKVNFLSI